MSLGVPPQGSRIDFHQCRFGARAIKPTTLLSHAVTLTDIELSCDHPKPNWTIPWSGRSYWAPHPILRGRQWAIPQSEWRAHVKRNSPPSCDYIPRQAAHYPVHLNYELAARLMWSAALQRERRKAPPRSLETTSLPHKPGPTRDPSGGPVIQRPSSFADSPSPSKRITRISSAP